MGQARRKKISWKSDWDNITEEEIENTVKIQKVKIKKEFDKKYKTQKIECIEKVKDTLITIQKAESEKIIYIITMWISKNKEVEKWKNAINQK